MQARSEMAQSIAKACGSVNDRNGGSSGPLSAVCLQPQPEDDPACRTPLTPLPDLNHPRVLLVFFSIAAAHGTRYSMPRCKHRLFGSTSPAYCRLPSERAAISRLSRPLDRFGQRWQEGVRIDGRHAIPPRSGLLVVLARSAEHAILLDMQTRDSIVDARQRTRTPHRT